jgi:translation initiation factor 1
MAPKDETRLVYSTDQAADASRKAPRERERAAPSRPDNAKGVRLRLERRASGRMATVITGLPGSEAELLELARALKTACGTGGTLKDGVLELQGDRREAVEGALAARGIPSKRAGG